MSVQRSSLVTVVLLGILVAALPVLQARQQPKPFAVEARWISGYTSLCDVEPKQSPKSATIPPGGGWTIAGCSDLNARPVAPLSLTFTNTDSATSRQLTIPLLSEVTIRTGGTSAPAAAFYVPWGSPQGFATDLKGQLAVTVAPRASVEFMYLLPKGGADAAVVVKGYGSVKLVPPTKMPQAPDKVKVTARLWTYSTLCDFADSPNPLIRESRAAGTSLSAEACEELITRWGHPPAVRLTIENLDTADHEIPLDSMSSIAVKTRGKTIAALAYRRKTSQPRFSFTTGITGSWILQVAPAQVIDVIVLFPQAEKGDQVTLGTIGTAKIQ